MPFPAQAEKPAKAAAKKILRNLLNALIWPFPQTRISIRRGRYIVNTDSKSFMSFKSIVPKSHFPYYTPMDEKKLRSVIAAGIRRHRKRLGLTIEKLAEASSLDSGYLAHIETASKTLSFAALSRILTALDISPEKLFHGNPKEKVLSPEPSERKVQAILRAFKGQARTDLFIVLSKLNSRKIRALKILLGA